MKDSELSNFSDLSIQLLTRRKSMKLGQEDMKMLAGMTQQQYQQIEAGRKDIRLSTLLRLAAALKMEVMLVPKEDKKAMAAYLQNTRNKRVQPRAENGESTLLDDMSELSDDQH